MKYLDEYREPKLARRLLEEIRRVARERWTIMEVCGGQTHGLLRYGIDEELSGSVELVHGPGCPVCVTAIESIDLACLLARQPGTILASFGDMLRVPGSSESLLAARAAGANVRPVYSPFEAVRLAEQHPNMRVVFFAVGFETTAPATALALLKAARLGLANFYLLAAHVRVQPAMEAVMRAPDCRVQGFLAAGHVCAVAGYESYREFAARHRVPVVVTGFEPLDLLRGILACVQQLEAGRFEATNQYERGVRAEGNPAARQFVEQVYETCSRTWRGMGIVPAGGLRLRPAWSRFDAELLLAAPPAPSCAGSECRAGDVLAGRIKPPECPHFLVACTPDNPLGAPMVSGEGACAAYFRYRGQNLAAPLENRA